MARFSPRVPLRFYRGKFRRAIFARGAEFVVHSRVSNFRTRALEIDRAYLPKANYTLARPPALPFPHLTSCFVLAVSRIYLWPV